jgi:hypothetical protein
MRPFFILMLLLGVIEPAGWPALISSGTDSSADMPPRDTPQRLLEAWLRFHETDLCQGVDAVFAFHSSGMEVWSLVEDEKSYQKLQELLDPLRASYRIELYTTWPQAEKKSESGADPPPSLWENHELRSYLGDSFARARGRTSFGDLPPLITDLPAPDEMLKQRLSIYAEQTLERNQMMKRYAMDLPALVRVTLDPTVSRALRSRASAVCMKHARDLSKCIEKLADSLRHAFPKAADEKSSRPEKSGKTGTALLESALQISAITQNVSLRVYHFIHPEHYTVGLDELRQPSLLHALATLEKMNSDFQKALATART